MHFRWLIICFLSISLILSSCSGWNIDKNGLGKVQEQQEVDQLTGEWWKRQPEYYELKDLPQPLNETEKQLMRKEGPYSGNKYNMELVKKKLDELPQDASGKEIEEAILHLIHEGYYKDVETFIRLNPNVEVNVERPDETIDVPAATKAHFSILLDASGSMNAQSKSGTRMEEAKSAIEDFIKKLPANSSVSLRVYGHIGTGSNADKQKSCQSTETIYHGEPNAQKINQALSNINPSGWTPIGKALAETKKDIPNDAHTAVVYVVSDGIETCGGDPVTVAKKLSQEGIKPIINIIGFQVDNQAQQLLKRVAEAGNGEFTYAGSKQELDKYLSGEYTRLQEAWNEWQRVGKELAKQKERELKEKADQTGKSIKNKSDLEFKRAEEIIKYLKESRGMKQTDQVWLSLKRRSDRIWLYGNRTQNKKWLQVHRSGNRVWWKFHREANTKWWDYYHKKK